MALPLRKPVSYQDIIDLPEHVVGEIIDGELYVQPRPAPRHAQTASSLGDELVSPFSKGRGGPGGWWILDEPELHLGPHVLVPDLAGWRRERMPKLPDTAWFELAPDWVCEVLSPGTAAKDRAKKMPHYAAEGVGYCWLIDPNAKTLEAFQNVEGRWLQLGVYQDADEISALPFDAISFSLGVLWAD